MMGYSFIDSYLFCCFKFLLTCQIFVFFSTVTFSSSISALKFDCLFYFVMGIWRELIFIVLLEVVYKGQSLSVSLDEWQYLLINVFVLASSFKMWSSYGLDSFLKNRSFPSLSLFLLYPETIVSLGIYEIDLYLKVFFFLI